MKAVGTLSNQYIFYIVACVYVYIYICTYVYVYMMTIHQFDDFRSNLVGNVSGKYQILIPKLQGTMVEIERGNILEI